ncbi:hypothetical protein BHM03_00034895 [Ensete ventricosum]|nr:hypothetical protein BHM03_00034895 [Ensete ventricosum]
MGPPFRNRNDFALLSPTVFTTVSCVNCPPHGIAVCSHISAESGRAFSDEKKGKRGGGKLHRLCGILGFRSPQNPPRFSFSPRSFDPSSLLRLPKEN